MAVALQCGVPPDVWLDDTRALFTAVELLKEQADEAKRAGRG